MVFNTIYNIINYIYMEISFISLIILVMVMVFSSLSTIFQLYRGGQFYW
jgi:hypothetical protein